MISRRGILGGLLAGLAAPAIIRTPGLLMAVKPMPPEGFLVRDFLTEVTGFGLPPLKIEGQTQAYDHVAYEIGYTVQRDAVLGSYGRPLTEAERTAFDRLLFRSMERIV